ncbi:fimbria/pilus outer membrane usher protein [Aeromonas salmonicida]
MRKIYKGLLLSLVLMYSLYSYGEELYIFDNAFLGDKNSINVNIFNQGKQLPGIYEVEVIINGTLVGNQEVLFTEDIKNGNGTGLMPCLNIATLSQYGIDVEKYSGSLRYYNVDLPSELNHDSCVDIDSLPLTSLDFLFHERKLLINAPLVAMIEKDMNLMHRSSWDDGINSAMINYHYYVNHLHFSDSNVGGSTYQSMKLEPGANIGAWRFRNALNWNSGSSQNSKWNRLYSYAERGLYDLNSTMLLGESYTTSDIFDSISFRGVEIKSSDQMLPSEYLTYKPVVKGVARTQARVEIQRKGVVIYNQMVSSGPFEISDLQLNSLSGDLDVTVWESDGTTQVYTIPYSIPIHGLKEGRSTYNLMLGEYRRTNSSANGPIVGQLSIMYGLPWNQTFSGGLQFSKHHQAIAPGINWDLGWGGAVSLYGIFSNSKSNNESFQRGSSYRIRYNKILNKTNTNISTDFQTFSTGFNTFNSALDSYKEHATIHDENKNEKYSRVSASLSQSLLKWGNLNISASRVNTKLNAKSTYVGVGFGTTFNNVMLSAEVTKTNTVYPDGMSNNDTLNSVSVRIPLETKNSRLRYAHYRYLSEGNGRNRHDISMDGVELDDALKWKLSHQRFDNSYSNDTTSFLGTYYNQYSQMQGNYSHSDSMKQVGMGVSGGALFHSKGVTFSQPLGDTIALIEVPDVSNVPVGSWPGVKTDFRGYTTLSHLAPYRENTISIDPNKLPSNVELHITDVKKVPTKGAVVPYFFKTNIGEKAIVKINMSDGSTVPYGALVELKGNSEVYGVVGAEGGVYLSGLQPNGTLVVTWGDDNECLANYALLEGKLLSGISVTSATCQ